MQTLNEELNPEVAPQFPAALRYTIEAANAEEGTIRKQWTSSIEHNAIHGSDDDTARF